MFHPSQTNTVFLNKDRLAQTFLNDIRAYKVLSADEQKQLLASARHGDLQARDSLILCNMRMVVSMAKNYGTESNYNDLVDEGVLGLNKAIEKFDLKKSNNFLTYAVYWVNFYMKEYLAKKDQIVAPKNNAYILKYVPKLKRKFLMENGREPTTDEILDMLEEKSLTLPPVESLTDIQTISIDGNYLDVNSESMFDFEKYMREYELASSSNNIDPELEKFDREAIIKVLMHRLDENERSIVLMKFGFNTPELTIEEIACRLDVEEKKVKKMYNTAIQKMNVEAIKYMNKNQSK